jgi:hypothetical protein
MGSEGLKMNGIIPKIPQNEGTSLVQ